jgi:hypothetical protein
VTPNRAVCLTKEPYAINGGMIAEHLALTAESSAARRRILLPAFSGCHQLRRFSRKKVALLPI